MLMTLPVTEERSLSMEHIEAIDGMETMSTSVESGTGSFLRMQLLKDLESIRRVAERIAAAEERWRQST
jgi:hypothetical protein